MPRTDLQRRLLACLASWSWLNGDLVVGDVLLARRRREEWRLANEKWCDACRAVHDPHKPNCLAKEAAPCLTF